MANQKSDKPLITWQKIGGGTHRFRRGDKVVVVPNLGTFQATEDEISLTFRDIIVPYHPIPKPEETPLEVKVSKYSVARRGATSWYDVEDANGKVQNEKELTQEDAEALAKQLNE